MAYKSIEKQRAFARAYYIKNKEEINRKNFKWLQIDHIVPQRKSKSRDDVAKLARQVVQGKRSDSEYQLLCANCNFAKRDLKACPIDHSLD